MRGGWDERDRNDRALFFWAGRPRARIKARHMQGWSCPDGTLMRLGDTLKIWRELLLGLGKAASRDSAIAPVAMP